MTRWLLAIALLSGCRTLLGIDEGVVGGDDGDDEQKDAASSDGSGNVCGQAGCVCTAHDSCDSKVCSTDGTCADASTVAYVEEGGAGAACLQALPCGTLNAGQATLRRAIKVTGSIRDTATVTFNAGSFVIYGGTADVSNNGSGAVIALGSSVDLTIYDLDIHGAASGTEMHGIFVDIGTATTLRVIGCRIYDNQGAGIKTEGGTILIDRTVLAQNKIVGVKIDSGTYTITNSIIVQNGNTANLPGGASLDPVGSTTVSRFELNTVADNISMLAAGQPVAIQCPADANIDNAIVRNGGLAGSCHPHYSMLDNPPGGGNNFSGAPDFIQTNDLKQAGFYRISDTSDARDRGTTSTVTVDIDRDLRPAAPLLDVGADEYVP